MPAEQQQDVVWAEVEAALASRPRVIEVPARADGESEKDDLDRVASRYCSEYGKKQVGCGAQKDQQHAIFAFLQKEGDGRQEVAVAAICNKFATTPKDEVRSALERLVKDGDLFTTCDEWHFQCL